MGLLHKGTFGLLQSSEEKEFEVIANPHQDGSCGSNGNGAVRNPRSLDSFLEPYFLLRHPLTTQPDTFQDLKFAKVMGIPIPVYHMKQPARLSAAELPFELVLVRDLTRTGKDQIQMDTSVPMERARDSWFPGYYWQPLYMTIADGGHEHVGWKFIAMDPDTASLPYFYALMVRMDQKTRQGEASFVIQGFQAGVGTGSLLRPL